MQIQPDNNKGIRISDIKNAITSTDCLTGSEKNSIWNAVVNANTMGEDDEYLEEIEQNSLIKDITTNFKDKSNNILSVLGLNKGNQADAVKNQDAAINNENAEEDTPECVKNDYAYKSYKKVINKLDAKMREIEEKYDFKRDNMLGVFKIEDTKERDNYSELELDLKMRSKSFKSYVGVMENWKDGALPQGSFVNHNGTRFTNIERLTLANGQHVYKASKNGGEVKYWYPYWDGSVGGPEISPEKIKEMNQPKADSAE